jgi:predicted ATPase/DNA-binding SARP family transcriptional activator
VETAVGTGVKIEPTLEIRFLGPLKILRQGADVALPASRKVRALIAYLALSPRAVPRSSLCELFWDVPNDPRGELRWSLSKIRGILDDPGRRRVLTQGDTVEFDLAGCTVDALTIAEAAGDLEKLPADRLQTLAGLFARDVLPNCELEDSPAFSGWLTAQRRRFHGYQTALLEQIVDRLPAGEGLPYLERWLELAPFDQRAHQLLLSSLAARNRLHEGEEHLAAAVRLFDREGLDSEALVRAWQSARTRTGAVTPGPRKAASSKLPLSLTRFVGRDNDLHEIAATLGEHRLVTITGPGGIGKTQTALRVACGLALEDEQLETRLVEFALVRDEEQVACAIAAAFERSDPSGHDILETLAAELQQRTMLLVLDNCEHLIETVAPTVEHLLRSCPGLRILATSRERLRVGAERVYRLNSLPVPKTEQVWALDGASARTFAAIDLFVDRAMATDHRFVLRDDEVPAVAGICRHLDGIPLAIELAAGRISTLPAPRMLATLDERFSLLSGGARTAPVRQQTMRAAISWSYDLLTPVERRVFERMSVFASACSAEIATAVCAEAGQTELDVLEALTSLVEKSMIVFDRADSRFGMLESFREFGHGLLVDRGVLEGIARRHASAFCDLAERYDRLYENASTVERVEAARNRDNWQAALEWTLTQRHDVELGQRITGALAPLWLESAGGLRWTGRALELATQDTPIEVMSRLQYARAAAHLYVVEPHSAIEPATVARQAFERLGDIPRATRAQYYLEYIAVAEDEITEAAEAGLNRTLQSARTHGLNRTLLSCLSLLVVIRTTRRDIAGGRAAYEEGLRISKTIGVPLLGLAMNYASGLSRGAGVEEAVEVLIDALRASGDGEDRELLRMHAEANLASYLVTLSRFEEARPYALRGLASAREGRHEFAALNAIQSLVSIAVLGPPIDIRIEKQHLEASALLLGTVDARFAKLKFDYWAADPPEKVRIVEALSERLGVERFDRLRALGASLSEHDATKLAFGL